MNLQTPSRCASTRTSAFHCDAHWPGSRMDVASQANARHTEYCGAVANIDPTGSNRLSYISGGVARSFQYCATGRRLAKTIAGNTTKFFYDGINIIQELNASNVPTANLLTGLGIDEVYSRTDIGGRQSFLSDALGSMIAMADSAGAVAASYTYEPYGKASKTGTTTNSQTYTGREDDGTGLYYYWARYYHPTLSRFISEYPLGIAAGPNVYAYVDGDPIGKFDPEGLAGKSPTFRCVNCGAPHGGLFGPYCPSCYSKSPDPNGGVPPLWKPPPPLKICP